MKIIITEEQNEKFNQKVKSIVEKYGIEEALRVFDKDTKLIRRAYQDNPSSFLEQFNNLTPFELEGEIYYMDKKGKPLFHYNPNKKDGYIDINYYRIWMFFQYIIGGFKYSEIQDIMKKWLEETYGIKGFTPREVLM
jgi:hypothetical protein